MILSIFSLFVGYRDQLDSYLKDWSGTVLDRESGKTFALSIMSLLLGAISFGYQYCINNNLTPSYL